MAHTPRKRFGQNFLQDVGYQRRIAQSIHLAEGAKCLEIGPGKGAITAHLLGRFGKLDAIEMDRDLVAILQRKFGDVYLNLHQGDALKMDFTQLAGEQRLSIIGNLPYNISSPILFHLIEHLDVIDEMFFMLQREVVDRLTANAGSKIYGRLSVNAGLLLESEKLFDVPPGAFYPVPKVVSSVVKLRPKQNIDKGIDRKVFSQIVTAAFSQRRKTLRNTLKQWATEAQLKALGIDPSLRAEAIDIETFALLAKNLQFKPD